MQGAVINLRSSNVLILKSHNKFFKKFFFYFEGENGYKIKAPNIDRIPNIDNLFYFNAYLIDTDTNNNPKHFYTIIIFRKI